MTMTLKQDYIPWTVHVAGALVDFQPLAAGFYFIQKVKNSYITPDKWLTLSFGIQIEWL